MKQPWLTRITLSSPECFRTSATALAARPQAARGFSGHPPIPKTQQHLFINDHMAAGAHNLPSRLVAIREVGTSRNTASKSIAPFPRPMISAVSRARGRSLLKIKAFGNRPARASIARFPSTDRPAASYPLDTCSNRARDIMKGSRHSGRPCRITVSRIM